MLRTGRLRTPKGAVVAPLRHRSLNRCREPHYRGLWRLLGPDSHRLAALSLSPELHRTSFSPDTSDCWTYASIHRSAGVVDLGSLWGLAGAGGCGGVTGLAASG